MINLLWVGESVFGTKGAAEGVTDQDEFLRQTEVLRDPIQIIYQLGHGVLGIRGITHAMTSKVRSDDPPGTREVVYLMFPGLSAAGVAMNQHHGLLDTLRLDVDDT